MLRSGAVNTFAIVNQQATIEEASGVFCGGHPEAEYRGSHAARMRIERFSRLGSWQNNLEDMARKELGCAKKTS
jgi:hypothetical protein